MITANQQNKPHRCRGGVDLLSLLLYNNSAKSAIERYSGPGIYYTSVSVSVFLEMTGPAEIDDN